MPRPARSTRADPLGHSTASSFSLAPGRPGAGISLLVGTSQHVLLRRLRTSSRTIQRAGSVLMLLVGVGLVYFTIDSDAFQSVFFIS